MPPNPAVTPSRSNRHSAAPTGPFSHSMLLYSGGDDGFVQGTLAAVRGALEREHEALVAVQDARANALRQALGQAASHVRFLDVLEVAHNPARLMPVWQDFADRQAAGKRGALGICEATWPGRSAAELGECERHEALTNLAFADGPAWQLLCPYDLDGLDDQVIEAAKCSHPRLWTGDSILANNAFAYATESPLPFSGSLPEPAAKPTELAFAHGELATVRHLTSAWAAGEGLDRAGIDDLVLAVDELAANSIRHGGGTGAFRYWREGDALLCEVCDAGTLTEPLLGRRRPAPEAGSGRGIWLVNQLCDLVQIRSVAGATVIRVHKLI